MQADIHPTLNNVIFRDFSENTDFKMKSTLTSDKKETIDGVEYYIINVEISSASHPFYTGKERLVDTAGRVDKFKQRETNDGASAADARRNKKLKRRNKSAA